MFSSSPIKLLLLLLLCSCAAEEVLVCAKSGYRCEKIGQVLSLYGVSPNISSSGNVITLKVHNKYKHFADKIIKKLESANVPYNLDESDGLKKLFLPKLNNTGLASDEIQQIILKQGVFEVLCTEDKISNGQSDLEFSCQLWFFSAIISKEKLALSLKQLKNVDKVKFKLTDLNILFQDFVNNEFNSDIYKDRMIILEPFSFHVPYIEKEVAGGQLILVLGLFLLSGFILGFWVCSGVKSSSDSNLENEY